MAEGGASGWDSEGYRGTITPNVEVPGVAHSAVITAVDAWAHGVELRGAAYVDRSNPFWLPRSWRVSTDVEPLRAGGGGGGSLTWHRSFTPGLPEGSRVLLVAAGPPAGVESARGAGTGRGGLAGSPLTIALPDRPWRVRRAAAVLDRAEAPVVSVPFRGGIEGAAVRPVRVIAVATVLEGAGGRDMCVLSVDVRPGWFALHIGGGGPLAVGERASRAARSRLGAVWTATDDRGGAYAGAVRSSSSGFPWTITATLAPSLDPLAKALTLQFPYPLGPGTVTTTIDLAPAA